MSAAKKRDSHASGGNDMEQVIYGYMIVNPCEHCFGDADSHKQYLFESEADRDKHAHNCMKLRVATVMRDACWDDCLDSWENLDRHSWWTDELRDEADMCLDEDMTPVRDRQVADLAERLEVLHRQAFDVPSIEKMHDDLYRDVGAMDKFKTVLHRRKIKKTKI